MTSEERAKKAAKEIQDAHWKEGPWGYGGLVRLSHSERATKPSDESIILAALRAHEAELRAEARKWEALHDELANAIMFEVQRDSYGPTETDAEAIKRIIKERDELRALAKKGPE